MSDNKAPDRIWAFHAPEVGEDNPQCSIVAGEHVMHGSQQYVRADLVQQWQPIETAPKDVWLITTEDGAVFFSAYGSEEMKWFCDHTDFDGNPTHWMPLPKAPTCE